MGHTINTTSMGGGVKHFSISLASNLNVAVHYAVVLNHYPSVLNLWFMYHLWDLSPLLVVL